MITYNRIFAKAELLWEIPLAFLSFIFFKVMKFVVGSLYNFRLSRAKEQNLEWRPLSTETLTTPITLPFWMTFGPRLNTHAIIATVGPFDVEKSLELSIKAANESAKSWTIVIYKFPDYQTVARIGSDNVNSASQWESIQLQRGKYLLGLRYYGWPEKVELPAVKTDGIEIIAAKNIPGDINNFYYDLRTRTNWFYLCLHYYIFVLLKFRKWLPQSFVGKEFLPVGDPALVYYYGAIKKGESLKVKLKAELFASYEVYLTVYDRSSFVSFFEQIETQNYLTEPLEHNGFYLFRVRQQPGKNEKFIQDWVEINLLSSRKSQINNNILPETVNQIQATE